MNTQKPIVVEMTHSFIYHHTRIDYDIWQTTPNLTPSRILFLGAAQMGLVANWVAEHCPPATLVVQGLPHWLVDDEDISGFAIKYIDEAFQALRAHYNLAKVDILVESQAAPSVTKLFMKKEYEENLRDLVLIQPLGLNAATFNDVDDPFALFLRRTARNARYQLPQIFDSKLYHNTKQLAKHLKLRDPKFRTHYTTGLRQNITSELKKLHNEKRHHIAIICGANDKLFSPEEIAKTLETHDIDLPVQLIPGVPHSPLATRQGLLLLQAAFDVLPAPNKN